MTDKALKHINDSTGRSPLVYRDMLLRFDEYRTSDKSFRIYFENDMPNGSSMRTDEAVRIAFDADALSDELIALERNELTSHQLQSLGKQLADLALPEGIVRTHFVANLAMLEARGEGLRLRLRIDSASLTPLPWEYIALPHKEGDPQPNDFLVLRRNVSIVRSDAVSSPRSIPLARPTARMVGVLSGPRDQEALALGDDQKSLTQVITELNTAVQTSANIGPIHLIWADRPTTPTALEAALADGADIFHFAGHGRFDAVAQAGTLVLETEERKSAYYDSQRLAQLLGDAGVRLALLGACDTGRREGVNVWGGIAAALTRQHIPAVIAYQFKIKDSSAALLDKKLYPLLLAGFTPDEAMFVARNAIFLKQGLEQRDWGTPVMYLRPQTDHLFPRYHATENQGIQHALRTVTKIEIEQVANAKVIGTSLEASKVGGEHQVDMNLGKVSDGAEIIGIVVC